MPVKVLLGLPYLSKGPLLAKAVELGAPVLVSANAFSRWKDDGPAPACYEYSRSQWRDHLVRGNTGPITHGRKQRMRTWDGWNISSLKNASQLREIHLDSAGFVAMSQMGGFPWSPEQYIFGLCAAFPWTSFASLDMCVEAAVAANRFEVEERIAKTVHLNKLCQILARDAGIDDRLMPVIQGATADDYLRCYDALQYMIGDDRVVGVGSMCRRNTEGPDGIVSIIDQLDRRLPKGVRLHLFGLKSDGAEAVADLDGRIASIDSQAYGFRARKLAAEKRRENPSFSKSNAFVAEVMETWYQGQVRRMNNPRFRPIQNTLLFDETGHDEAFAARDPWYRAEAKVRAEINQLIADMEMDHDQMVSPHMVLAWMSMMEDEDEDDIRLPLAA